MKKKCVIISAKGRATFNSRQLKKLEETFEAIFIENLHRLTHNAFVALVKDAEVLAITRRSVADLDGRILSRLAHLTGIALYATGYEWVDVDYCKARGIMVTHLEDYSAETVAEQTLAMLLAISRRLHMSFDKSRHMIGEEISLRGFELKDKKIGIWGFGTIGKRFAELVRPLTSNIYFYDVKKHLTGPATFTTRDELLAVSDILVLLANKTRGEKPLIGKAEIQKMKKGVVLINSSRASLVDNEAVIRGIHDKIIYGYAVDDAIEVFNTDAIEYGRILQTYHTGWYADEAIARGTEQWVDNIISLQ